MSPSAIAPQTVESKVQAQCGSGDDGDGDGDGEMIFLV